MKKKMPAIMFGIAFCILFSVSAHAEGEYIIKLTCPQLFSEIYSDERKIQDNFVVVDSMGDVQKYIDAGVVEYYEPNYEVELFAAPNDEQYIKQKFHKSICSQKAWDIETYGNDVNIAIIDSGCFSHADIISNLSEGYNYLSNDTNTSDTVGHGTHISGMVGAEMNDIGVVGIANRANIIPLKCFDVGVTTKVATIVDAIYDAVDKYDCDIINMSWGVSNNSKALSEAVTYAAQKGVIMIAAVGNGGGSDLAYPAAYDSVIGVGSVDDDMNHSQSSRHNTSVFVVAPGENIFSIDNNGGYSSDSGTSFSAPMVTALSAIALNIDSGLTVDVLKKNLEACSIDLGIVGYDEYYGYGMINIENIIDNMLLGKKLYIAPIDVTDGVAKIALYNSDKDLCEGVLMTAFYADDIFQRCTLLQSMILPHETKIYSVSMTNTNERIKCFCWESLNTLFPLSNIRTK